MSTNQIVEQLKSNGEDFEWYPTTQEIVNCLAKKIFTKRSYGQGEYECKYHSVLDIGCGNGSFFEKIDRTEEQKASMKGDYGRMLWKRFGIERSFVLCEQLPNDVVIIGSDFYEQSLIDKKVDLIFFNPPYSEFELWTEKIIMQGNCEAIALVIPCRWKVNPKISYALKKRGMDAETLGTFDFLNAERRARAKVDLLFISADEELYNGNRHVKFRKEFMQKLNVEMARINGWVQDKSEAAEEFGLNAAEIERAWGSNRKLEIAAGKQLLGLPA